jgi:hypothetical protein
MEEDSVTKRRLSLVLVLAIAALGLVYAGSASAYSPGEKKAEAKQNKRIKTALKGLSAQQLVNDAQTKQLTDLDTLTKSIDNRLKLIEGAAPQIIDGLSQLKDAATQLKTGLETAGAGLTSLKTLAGATEYGIGQVIVLEPAANPQEGSFVVTPDIPDAVQQAQTSQQLVAQQSGALAVAYGVRSGESDGTGSSLPAAHCKVTVTNEAGDIATTAANPSLGGLPFQPVNTKSALTSTTAANAGFPFGLKTDNTAGDADVTTTFVSSVNVAAGDSYEVALSCVDTSASSSDPSA